MLQRHSSLAGQSSPDEGNLRICEGIALDDIASAATLQEAWRRVRANRGGPGGDGVDLDRFAQALTSNLDALGRALLDGSYKPGPLRRARIPKADGSYRRLTIPTIADRIVQTAALVIFGPCLDQRMSEASWAYRPHRGVADALAAVREGFSSGYLWTLDADISRFFDRVPHARLKQELAIWVDDERVLRLFTLWLRGFSRFRRGIAQGAPISPLLANLYLHPIDRLMGASGHTMIRYADDFVVLGREKGDVMAAKSLVSGLLRSRGLTLKPEKTRILPPGEPFVFLGEALVASQEA
jgi:CRISPR-associated protein Cas1